MLPTSWRRVPITGRFVGRDGVPIVGRLVFDSAQTVEIDGVQIVPRSIAVTLDEDGSIPSTFSLPSTHDPDLSVTGWTYTVQEDWPRGKKPYRIFVPHEADSINLPTLAPIVAPPIGIDTRGPRGYSAYEIALRNGFVGTEEEWLESLQNGPPGDTGPQGPPGPTEYGVLITSSAGQFIAPGGYPAARSVPRAAAFRRIYVETDADIVLRIQVGGSTVFEQAIAEGAFELAVEPIALDPGMSVVFFIMSGDATSVWAQIDDGDVSSNFLTLDSGEPITLDNGEPIEL